MNTVDQEVHELLSGGYERARSILSENADRLHALAKLLAEYEKVEGPQFEALMRGEEVVMPDRSEKKEPAKEDAHAEPANASGESAPVMPTAGDGNAADAGK